MANLKTLAKDTVIYGFSSIIGRFLNYLLVPLYTQKLSAASGSYGIVTNVYAYTALLLVLLTFGMETTFFRYANKKDDSPMTVYSTTLIAVGTVCLFFMGVICLFLDPIAAALHYSNTPQYVMVMAICVAIDAFQSIPYAFLRYKCRPIKFASLKVLFIVLNITLNLVYFLVIPLFYHGPNSWVAPLLGPGGTLDVGYVFYINLLCTSVMTLFFYKELTGFRWKIDWHLLGRMLNYSWPILILGLAGILNQTADKIIYPFIRKGAQANAELGVYGACVKIAMIMAMITQAFRYAYEPFVFGQADRADGKNTYANAMKYFIIFTLLAFLIVMGYIDIFKYMVAPDYRSGLKVVPIVMSSTILLGVYFNLSFWYKLIDKTMWGAVFSIAGCTTLVIVDVLFIPQYHYMACAWGGVAGYGVATLLSYFVGQKYYPINYPLKKIGEYVLLTGVLYFIMTLVPQDWNVTLRLLINTGIILAYIGHVIYHDFPMKRFPLIGKYFK